MINTVILVIYHSHWFYVDIYVVTTRNELALLAHAYLLHLLETSTHASIVLLSSTLDYVVCMMLDPQL